MKNYQKECSKEICKYMQNSSLLHLDISYNNFSYDDMILLQTALLTNQTLIGLHLEGNSGAYTDTNGFIAFKNERKIRMEEAIA